MLDPLQLLDQQVDGLGEAVRAAARGVECEDLDPHALAVRASRDSSGLGRHRPTGRSRPARPCRPRPTSHEVGYQASGPPRPGAVGHHIQQPATLQVPQTRRSQVVAPSRLWQGIGRSLSHQWPWNPDFWAVGRQHRLTSITSILNCRTPAASGRLICSGCGGAAPLSLPPHWGDRTSIRAGSISWGSGQVRVRAAGWILVARYWRSSPAPARYGMSWRACASGSPSGDRSSRVQTSSGLRCAPPTLSRRASIRRTSGTRS
jgi:hypothetical protein